MKSCVTREIAVVSYLSRDFISTARGLELGGDVPSHNGPRDSQGEVHEEEDSHHELVKVNVEEEDDADVMMRW